jgi:DinB superfamily
VQPFNLEANLELLERTPRLLYHWLGGLPDLFTRHNEGPETWSPYDVLGHLVHGERTDWIARLEIILSDRRDKLFTPFDRFAQFQESAGKSLGDLLGEFSDLRAENLAKVRSRRLSPADLARTGVHPKFGDVTARELLATWAAHDLDHVMQISRVMAKQIGANVGPWVEYLRILK